jgi:putative Ca2+/H+ antiporter (TMEM165/GDT1 family)
MATAPRAVSAFRLMHTTQVFLIAMMLILRLDRHIISTETFTALLLMSLASTMLTVPVAAPLLRRMSALLGRAA